MGDIFYIISVRHFHKRNAILCNRDRDKRTPSIVLSHCWATRKQSFMVASVVSRSPALPASPGWQIKLYNVNIGFILVYHKIRNSKLTKKLYSWASYQRTKELAKIKNIFAFWAAHSSWADIPPLFLRVNPTNLEGMPFVSMSKIAWNILRG